MFKGRGTAQLDKRNNGNQRPQLPTETWLNGLVSNSDMPSVYKELLHPGHDAVELIMRTILPDERKANAAVLLFHRIKEFDLGKEYEQLVLMKIASYASIKGIARREAVMVATGVVSSMLYNIPSKEAKRYGDNDRQERRERDDE
jgi:hypothetical protein